MSDRAPREVLLMLADKFVDIYGETFTSTIMPAEKFESWVDMWGAALADVTPEQIEAALVDCKSKFEYPPSQSSFKSLIGAQPKKQHPPIDVPYKHKEDRAWALKPRSQAAVDLMFTNPQMTREIAMATRDGYISGHMWVPEHKRKSK